MNDFMSGVRFAIRQLGLEPSAAETLLAAAEKKLERRAFLLKAIQELDRTPAG